MPGTYGKMDYEQVELIAKGFDSAGDVLRTVNTALEGLLVVLKTTAFIGRVGGAALQRYIENIKPHVAKLSTLSEEYAVKLRKAIENHKAAVQAGEQAVNTDNVSNSG